MTPQFATIAEMFENSIVKNAHRIALSFVEGQPYTYYQVGESVKQLRAKLTSLGVGVGDRVAILAPNSPNWSMAFFAITTMGATAVPLLPDFSKFEVENILKHSESKVVFLSEKLASKLDVDQIKYIENVINLESGVVVSCNSSTRESSNKEVFTSETLASIIYTSGTTGRSKGVMLSHRNLMCQLEMIFERQEVLPTDVFLSLLPLSHTYENSLGLLTPFNNGSSVYYLDKPPTPTVLLPAIQKVRPTVMLTVPMIIEKIYKNKILPKFQSSFVLRNLYKIPPFRKLLHRKASEQLHASMGGRLRFFGVGGAKLDPVVDRFLIEGKKMPLAIGYGLTETAPMISGSNPKTVIFQGTGVPVIGIEMIIKDPLPKSGIGEVWVRGANVMKGYYKDPQTTAEVLTPDGWFKTGDLGVFDNQGRLYIKGRKKNMILGSSGENIYPEEIESVINNFKYVIESVVVQQKGRLVAMVRFNHEELEQKIQDKIENIKAEVEQLRNEAEVFLKELESELMVYVNSRVSKFSKISLVVAVSEDFEKTSTQKIKRYLYN